MAAPDPWMAAVCRSAQCSKPMQRGPSRYPKPNGKIGADRLRYAPSFISQSVIAWTARSSRLR
jgi:hypothetical protein